MQISVSPLRVDPMNAKAIEPLSVDLLSIGILVPMGHCKRAGGCDPRKHDKL